MKVDKVGISSWGGIYRGSAEILRGKNLHITMHKRLFELVSSGDSACIFSFIGSTMGLAKSPKRLAENIWCLNLERMVDLLSE
jgi:hypothetical protein